MKSDERQILSDERDRLAGRVQDLLARNSRLEADLADAQNDATRHANWQSSFGVIT
jgi:hypothetical protein